MRNASKCPLSTMKCVLFYFVFCYGFLAFGTQHHDFRLLFQINLDKSVVRWRDPIFCINFSIWDEETMIAYLFRLHVDIELFSVIFVPLLFCSNMLSWKFSLITFLLFARKLRSHFVAILKLITRYDVYRLSLSSAFFWCSCSKQLHVHWIITRLSKTDIFCLE